MTFLRREVAFRLIRLIRRLFMKKVVVRDLIVLVLAMTALIIAAVNLNTSLNLLGEK